MKIMLLGGICDGEICEAPEPAPEVLYRMSLSPKQMEALPEGKSKAPMVEYRRTQRIRGDGCLLYVLKGARL